MSRIGRMPVEIPSGVSVETAGRQVRVKGPKGELSLELVSEVDVAIEGKEVKVTVRSSDRNARAFHGMTRALVANMVHGVAKGYEKTLEIIGVGWNASVEGRTVVLNVGYCHPVRVDLPPGVDAQTPSPTTVTVSGPDKQLVGQIAASLRASRKPEPYKGKGVRYRGEYVRQKAGKSFGT